MPSGIRAKIEAEAEAEHKGNLAAIFGAAASAFDLWIPAGEMERLGEGEVRPAFEEFISLQAGAWHCVIGDVRHLNLPAAVGSEIGCHFPLGIALRLSRMFGLTALPQPDDPHCALLYDPRSGRAFWFTVQRGREPVLLPLPGSRLVRAGMLELLLAFAKDTRRSERSFPFTYIGLEPLPRIARAA